MSLGSEKLAPLAMGPFLAGSAFFLKGKGTLVFGTKTEGGLDGRDGGRMGSETTVCGGETSSSSPSSGDEVAVLFGGRGSGERETRRFVDDPV